MYYLPGSILYLFIAIALMRKEASARMEIADVWVSWGVLFVKFIMIYYIMSKRYVQASYIVGVYR